MPNNSYWENGSSISQPANLVVTRGADEGSPFYSDIFFPETGSQTISVTIQNACDNDPGMDVGGSRANDQFIFEGASSVVVTSGDATVYVYGDPSWEYLAVTCNSGSDITVNVTIDSSIPADSIINTPSGPKNFREMFFEAGDESYAGSGDWENSFRLFVNGRSDVITSFAGANETTDPWTFALTGIYNRNSAISSSCSGDARGNGQCYWDTSTAFAPPCDWSPGATNDISFFDDDGAPSEYQGLHQVIYNIYEYKRDGSGDTSGSGPGNRRVVRTGFLTGASNSRETISGISFDPQFSYELELHDIYIRNSIQVILPWSQISSLGQCAPPTSTIEGYKVDQGGDPNNPLIKDIPLYYACCTLSGNSNPKPENPYFFTNLPHGNHEIDINQTDVPAGWIVKYTLCFDAGSFCPNPDPGTLMTLSGGVYKVVVDTSGHNTADLWFHFYPPPVVTSCNAIKSDPLNPEPGEPFTIDYSFTISGGSPGATYDYSVSLGSISSVPAGGTFSGYSNPVGSGNTPAATLILHVPSAPPPTVVASAPGRYSGRFTIKITGQADLLCDFGPSTPSGPIVVVTKPYFQVNDGDVAAGISTRCAGWSLGPGTGSLISWNNFFPSPNNFGASTNLAAYAFTLIKGFASASAQGPLPPRSLSFANTSALPFGGGFLNGAGCPTDYYNSPKVTPVALPGTSVRDDNGIYAYSGTLNLTGGNVKPDPVTGHGHRTAIYVNGDVYIGSDITVTSGTSLDSLSSFYLIAKGNIYMSSGVHNLDGVYVAQPGGGASGGGKIYTCYGTGLYNAPNNIAASPELINTCNSKLTIKGALIANELKFYRSWGSVSDLAKGPAEVFYYNPAIWLVAPCSISDCGPLVGSGSGYDAITSLPPVL